MKTQLKMNNLFICSKPLQLLNVLNIVQNSKNLGQSYSIHKGILNSSFNTIVTIDADGQNNPVDIPKLVEGTLPQHRVTKLAPREVDKKDLENLFKESLVLW